jgi:hypothetical protein
VEIYLILGVYGAKKVKNHCNNLFIGKNPVFYEIEKKADIEIGLKYSCGR